MNEAGASYELLTNQLDAFPPGGRALSDPWSALSGDFTTFCQWVDLTLTFTLRGGMPGGTVAVYVMGSGDYYDHADFPAYGALPAGLFAGEFRIRTDLGVQRLTLRGLPIHPHWTRVGIENRTGGFFAASGNVLSAIRYGERG